MNTLRRRIAALACAALVSTTLPIGASAVEAAGEHLATLPTDNPANFSPNVLDGEVLSIWQVGDRVVIGGSFTQVANSTAQGGTVYDRTGVASFDAATGLVDENFAPDLDGDVEVVIPAADGTSIYIGGSFRTVDGVYRRKLARLDLASGSLVTQFDVNGLNGLVRDVRLVDDHLIVGGLFTSIGGQPRAYLASVDATTGNVTDHIDSSVLGQHNGGLTKVIKLETTPDDTRLMVIGNFTSIDGQPREQIALLDLTQEPATVTPWHTDFFTSECHPVFDSFLRDLDIAPTGDYAVVTTTGAYRPDTSCDTISRLPIDVETADVEPDWVNYTGGDTSYAVEIHDGVAYVGGHMRWVDNPYAADRHGAGGVAREGMAALDVITGLPYSWDPGRDRGVGLFDYHVTEQGIWAGSDTDRWNNELRMKLAFFPWAGGTSVQRSDIGDLPNDIFQLGLTSGTTGTDDPSVLYRVNAGGPELASVDDGPVWEADTSSFSPYRNSGSSIATAPSSLPAPSNHSSVPNSDLDRPPSGIYVHERWDGSNGDEMEWEFPVTAGTPIQVRLYLANRCRCTNGSGERVFDVDLDGVNVIDDLDLTNVYGHDVGAMQSFDIVSDGTVDIRFRHAGADNPLVNAIEIIRTDVPTGGTFGEQDQVTQLTFDGANPPTGVSTSPGTAPWHTVRGAFMADDDLYTLRADGAILRHSVDGGTIDHGAVIDTWSNDIMNEMPTMTGVFYDPDTSRIFYTLAGENSLYTREFLAESATISATREVAGGDIAALSPARVRGMFIGQGHLWFADASTGALMKIAYSNGAVSGAVQVADTSIDWRSRALFRTTDAQPNQLPTAAFTAACSENTCTFDGSTSFDTDGTIVDFDWDFGDGNVATGETVEHSYAAGGTYDVTLTVTDDRGGTDVIQSGSTVTDPPNVSPTADASVVCTRLDCTFDGTGSIDPDGVIVDYAWSFGDGVTATGAEAQHTYSVAGTYEVTLTVTDAEGATGLATTSVDVFDATASVGFRAANEAYANTPAPSVTIPNDVVVGDQLVYILSVNRSTTVTGPTGWTLVATEQDGQPDLTSWVFTTTADETSAGATITSQLGARSKSASIVLAYQKAAPVLAATSATTGASSDQLQSPSVTVGADGSAVVSYWVDKTGGNTGWTLPPSVAERSSVVGSGGGRVTAAAGDSTVSAGTWPGATATSGATGSKGIAWTIVLAPSEGNAAPVAAATAACNALSCDFDGSTSVDPDGTIVEYDWDFGDGSGAVGAQTTHVYLTPGTYSTSLTVTDDGGASATYPLEVTVSESSVMFRDSAGVNVNSPAPTLTVPNSIEAGDQLVLFATFNRAATAVTPAGWTLLGSAEDGKPDIRSFVYTRTAGATDAGSTVTIDLDGAAKSSLILLGYAQAGPISSFAGAIETGSSSSLTTPTVAVDADGSLVVSYWVDKTGGNTGWVLPENVVDRRHSVGSGGGRVTAAAGDTAVPTGLWPGATASGAVNGGKAIAWSVVVPAE